MKKNMGRRDTFIRATIAGIIAILYFLNIIDGTLAFILETLAIILFITSLVGFCPLYALFGYSSRKKAS